MFAGPHHALKVGILGRYFLGVNLAKEQLATERDVERSEGQQMSTQLREGSVKKSPLCPWHPRGRATTPR